MRVKKHLGLMNYLYVHKFIHFLLAQSQTLVSGCVHDILISCEVGFACVCVCVCADDVTSIVFDWLKRLMLVSSEFITFRCFKIFSPRHWFEQNFVNS